MSKSTLGTRIKTARKARSMTQFQLAQKACTTQQTICDYEVEKTGNFRPDLQLVTRIAKALEVSPTWLLFGN